MRLINTTPLPVIVTIVRDGESVDVHLTAKGYAPVSENWTLPDTLPAGVIKEVTLAERKAAAAARKAAAADTSTSAS